MTTARGPRRADGALLGALLLGLASAAQAQDVSLQGGLLHVNAKHENSFAAALNYTHPVGQYLAMSLSYLNEGHPAEHHRDGIAGQLWLRSRITAEGLSFGAAAGQYYYFDTARNGSDYTNDHGLAPIYSVQASWHYPSGWYGQIQLNRIYPRSKDATTNLLIGAGYRFDNVRGDKLHLDGPSTDDTITVMGGQSIVNSFNSERSKAHSIEYRRATGRYVDWTVSWVNEGTTARTRRNGIATQAWLIRSLSKNVELGMGAGPYGVLDHDDVPGSNSHLAALVSIGARYHISKRIVGQLLWQRVMTDYHRDADLLMLGLGASY